MTDDDQGMQTPHTPAEDQQDPPESLEDQQDDDQQDDDQQDDDQQDDDQQDDDEQDDDETFPRPYVERLRARSAGYRTRANAAEARAAELEQALFTERVRALDVLADPAELPFDADLLDDPDALRAAVDNLVRERPHYRRRGTASARDTGSHDRGDAGDAVSLAGIMRGHS